MTELDVQAQDENRRADFYEKALRSFYGHPAVEGILFWGFWDQLHWRGEKAALVRGDNLEVLGIILGDKSCLAKHNRFTMKGLYEYMEVVFLTSRMESPICWVQMNSRRGGETET